MESRNTVEQRGGIQDSGRRTRTRCHRGKRLPSQHASGIKAHRAMANNETQPFPFLRLAPELRNYVYEELLPDSAETIVVPIYRRGFLSRWTTTDHPGRDLLALATASHQLHDEAMLLYSEAKLLYYNTHTFEFNSLGMMGLFLDDIGSKCKDAIKSVRYTVSNEIRLLDVFEALKGCDGLERLEIKISFSGSANYGENGVLILHPDELISRILGPSCPLPQGLKGLSISRSIPDQSLIHPIFVAKKIFDSILEDKIKDHMDRQRKLKESRSATAELSQVFADLDLWS
ncbi:MAG: hypothetical protein M1812_004495 [Candelaria pacifica]|nr:MAG: hypothetical protein M1812_004495 [Candelaria pacifica]